MRALLLLVVATSMFAGCEQPANVELLSECFAVAAYDVYVAELKAEATPEKPDACCAGCKGTGKVLSGDSITKVPCPCPASCPCKKAAK